MDIFTLDSCRNSRRGFFAVALVARRESVQNIVYFSNILRPFFFIYLGSVLDPKILRVSFFIPEKDNIKANEKFFESLYRPVLAK